MSSVIAAIGIWLMFVLVFTTLIGADQRAPASVEEKGGQQVVAAIQTN